MKKFQFRLERVLQYRRLLKDERVRELLKRRHKLLEDHERLRELESAALLNRLEENARLSAEQVQLLGMYAARLREEIGLQQEEVEKSQTAVAEAQQEYIEAAKEEETLETLKSRRLDEFRDALDKEEIKEIDELTVQRIGHERLIKE